jgi:5-formyltetrahydrofolate cyclo-ligase
MNTKFDKTALRRALLNRREASDEKNKRFANQSIKRQLLELPQLRGASAAFVYVSADGEVDTHGLIDTLDARGGVVLVPRIVDQTHMRAVRFPGWAAMRPGPLGILSPPDDAAFDDPIEVAIVPGLGFSPTGARLGFGAGYYDRWFAANCQITKIGVAFDDQLVDQIPVAPHDVAMDLIVTERRLIVCARKDPQGGCGARML